MSLLLILLILASSTAASALEHLDDDHHHPERGKVCSYGGKDYEHGETWTAHGEHCTECTCSSDGVVSCQRLKCDVPEDCRVVRTEPNSCCPLCTAGCVTRSGKFYNDSETWAEDDCTQCECREGRITCHASMCRTECEHPVYVAGECCPRCEHDDASDEEKYDDDDEECGHFDCEGRECPHGFSVDDRGCPTCQCSKCPAVAADCHLDCPLGYKLDQEGCPICSCAPHSSLKTNRRRPKGPDWFDNFAVPSDLRMRKPEEQINPGEMVMCESVDEKNRVISRAEGAAWSDGCRQCLCKFGREMCTLISCRTPSCEHPVYYPGDCCPKCPNEETAGGQEGSHRNVSICPSSDSSPHVEGDQWNLTPCLKCTCHRGLTLCSHQHCPPAPCEAPQLDEISCCPRCLSHSPTSKITNSSSSSPTIQHDWPSNNNELLDIRQGGENDEDDDDEDGGENRNVITNRSSHSHKKKGNCVSDDSHKEYSHGDSWKVGPCQSCVCQDGKIECFSSSANCPRVACERPVLAKDQCCPICLDGKEKVKTEMNCTMTGTNETWRHGQSWTVDKCTHCVCNAPLIQCTSVICSVSCRKPLLFVANECCPICPPDEDIMGTKSINALPRSGGLEPYCAIVIAALLCTTSVLSLYVLRMMYRRRRRRRLTDKSLPSNQRPEYCYFNNNKKYECSTSIGSSTDMTPAVEKKLLCPNVSV